MKNLEHMVISIADINFAIYSNQPTATLWLEKGCRDFLSNGEPAVIIHARYDGMPQITLEDKDKIFDSEMIWKLYRVGAQNVLVFRTPIAGQLPYRIAIFNANFSRGDVYSRLSMHRKLSDRPLPNPLEHPLAEILMMCLLAQGRGVLVHACGIDDNGRGYLFAGNSTHGKSTLARIWRDKATILNDDRIVLRHREGRFWMYGTPWHGDYTGVSPKGVPLEKVFFIRHAEANTVSREHGTAATTMLLTRSFSPLWDKDAISFTLDFCAQLVGRIPCYELGFAPDGKIVDFVRCVE